MDQMPTKPTPNDRIALADALEECRGLLDRGATVESCLAAFPFHADELRSLLPLVVRAQRLAPPVDARVAERSRHRFRAYVEAKQGEARKSSGLRVWLWRLAGPVAAAMILTASSLGLAQASSDTLPDSPLYTVKQARETLGQILTITPAARASYQTTLARRRLNELNRAEELRKPNVARVSALGMVDATQRAVNNTLKTNPTQRKVLEARLHPLIRDELRSLETLAREAPPPSTPAIQHAEQILKDQETLISH